MSLRRFESARTYRPKADMAGALASGVCAVHCALMPFAAAMLPSAVARVFESEWVHNLFAMVNELVINADEDVFEMNNGCICCTVRW